MIVSKKSIGLIVLFLIPRFAIGQNSVDSIVAKQDIQGKIRAEELKYKKEFSQWKADELNRLRSLKIIIPNDLMDIYQFVTSYGKQSGE